MSIERRRTPSAFGTNGCLFRRAAALASAVTVATSSHHSTGTGFVGAFRLGHRSAADIRRTSFVSRRTVAPNLSAVHGPNERTLFRTPGRSSSNNQSPSALSMIAKSGGKEILTMEQFAEDVLSPDLTERPVLVFYSAPWCGPCRLSNPVVKETMREFAGKIDVVEVCTDDFAEIAAEAGVVSIPTIQLFYGGELIDTIVGCVAKNVLASAVVKVLEECLPDDDEEVST